MINNIKNTIEQRIDEPVVSMHLLAETAPSRIYLVRAGGHYIVKESKKSDIEQEFGYHKAIYEYWLSERSQWEFGIPKPYFLSDDQQFFMMEYIEGDNLLRILLRGTGDVKGLFRQTGKYLRQFHDMTTAYLTHQTKPLTECETIKKLMAGSRRSRLKTCLEAFSDITSQAIFKDFTPSNVVISQTGRVYFLDYHDLGYCAPFYYDLARFVDTTRVFGLIRGLPNSVINFYRVRQALEGFLEGYGDDVESSLLKKMQIVHRKEHVRKKLDVSLWRGVLLWLTYLVI